MVAVDGSDHGNGSVHVTDIILEACAVVGVVVAGLGIPHEVGDDAKTVLDQRRAVAVLEGVFTAAGNVVKAFVVRCVKFLLKNGCVEGGEGDKGQGVAIIERLVTDGAQGVGQGHLLDGCTRKRHSRDAHRAVGNVHLRRVARVGNQLKAAGNHAVEVTVNDAHVFGKIEGVDHGFVVLAVEIGDLNGGEGGKAAECKRVIAKLCKCRTELQIKVCKLLLVEGVRADIGSTRKVSTGQDGVRKRVIAHVGKVLHAVHICQRAVVCERAFLHAHVLRTEGDLAKLLAVCKGVSAELLHACQVDLRKRGGVECVAANLGQALKVDVRELAAVHERHIGHDGYVFAQRDLFKALAVSKRLRTDRGSRAQVHVGQRGSKVAVNGLTVLVVNGRGEALVVAIVVNVTRECVRTDRENAREVDMAKGGVVKERVIANHCALTQRHALKVDRTVEGAVADLYVVANGQRGQRRLEGDEINGG